MAMLLCFQNKDDEGIERMVKELNSHCILWADTGIYIYTILDWDTILGWDKVKLTPLHSVTE